MAAAIDIVIVNWNAGKQLLDCLKSLEKTTKEGFYLKRIVIVDNASTDDSLNYINQLELPITIIKNSKNMGFGAACNQGVEGSSADYILFLNPDMLLYNDSLLKPFQFMESEENSKIGACGIQLVSDNGEISRSCTRFPKPHHFFIKILGLDSILPGIFHSHFMEEWDHKNTRAVDHIIGAFYLVRHKVFKEIGGFDQRFFVYLEDLDLSHRIYEKGYNIVYLADACAYHKGGGTSDRVKAKRLFYSVRSRIIYGFKYFSPFYAFMHLFASLFIEPLCRLVLAAFRLSREEAQQTIEGYRLLFLDISNILSFRGSRTR